MALFNIGYVKSMVGYVVTAVAESWLPSDLGADLLQWLNGLTSPATVDDDSDNAVDANLTGSVCATFDGVPGGDSISMMGHEDAWNVGTSDFYIEVYASSTAGGAFVSKFSAGNNERSFLLTQQKTTGDLIFYTSSTGTDQVASTVDVLDYPSDYSVIRVEKSGTSVTWYVDGVERTSTGSAVADIHASSAAPLIGNYWWDYPSDTATRYNDFEGTISTVEIGLGTTDTLSYYPLIAGSGLDVFDTVGNVHGVAQVGAGGEATFWGTRQDDRHYMATDGGSKVFVFEGASVSMFGTAVSTGTKELSFTLMATAAADQTVFVSNSKSFFLDFISGTAFDVYYNGGLIDTAVLNVPKTFTLDVDLGSAFTFGSSAENFQIADITLEDNGGWKASGFDGTTAYNTDQSGSMPDMTDNAVTTRQYPALSSGLDDVAGFGLLNPAATDGAHNGGIYKVAQKANRDYGIFNGTSSCGLSDASGLGSVDWDYELVADWYKATATFYLFSDGDGGTGGERISLFNSSNDLKIGIDDDSTFTQETILSADDRPSTDDVCVFRCWRISGTIYWSMQNLTQGTTDTGNFANTQVVDNSGQKLAVGCLNSGGPLNYAPINVYYFKAGTSASAITHSYSFNDEDSGTIADGVGSNDMTLTSVTTATTTTPLPLAFDAYLGDNLFWSADGVTFDEKTYLNMFLHTSYNNDVWIKYGDGCMVEDIVTTDTLDEDQYDNMAEWKGATSCGNGVLPFDALLDSLSSPLIDSEDSYLTTAEI